MKYKGLMYDKGTMKVIVLACMVIVISVVMTGAISYFITRTEIVDKLKSRDMVYIISSIAAKIDGRLERAQEAALILAEDPAVIEWVAGSEQDDRLGQYAKDKITLLAGSHGYSNAFIVSAVTRNYWAEGARKIDVLSVTDPDDVWFFDFIAAGKAVELSIDSNKERNNTFVFVNALMRDRQKPLAVVGVGLNIKDIAKEFQSYKIGERSNLWLVDGQGKIYLSEDIDHIGLYLNDFVSPELSGRIVADAVSSEARPVVIEYVDRQDETMDLVYLATRSTDWKLVFQMPRTESTALLNNIRLNTMIAAVVSLILIVFIFYFISARIANPLKRAVLLGQEMEKLVAERTWELAQQNQKIMDSIDYARRLQESILPPAAELSMVFQDFFVIWKPRDWVGGDFYWVRKIDDNRVLAAVVDCTGHGVPGAFMTMAVNSILDNLVSQGQTDPALILAELNRQVKETLHRSDSSRVTDDGLDIGFCYVEQNRRLVFAGAKIPLYVKRNGQVHQLAASKKSIGYRRSNPDLAFVNTEWLIEPGDIFFMTSDGFIDQNGGGQDYPIGRRRFVEAIGAEAVQSLTQQQEKLEQLLVDYMDREVQRDDITVLGFRFSTGGDIHVKNS